MMRANYPNLALLLAGYFHEDWMLEHASSDEAVRAFREGESAARVLAAKHEIQQLLHVAESHHDLSAIIADELGSLYDPRLEGKDPRDWLIHVQQMLSS